MRVAFLEAYSKIGTIRGACEAVGCNRQTILNWRNDDQKFAAAFDTADVEFTEALVSIVHQRAAQGSDNLLMFAVKKRDPSFRENMKVEHSGKMTLEQLVHASIDPTSKP